jgi:hypothetical protein
VLELLLVLEAIWANDRRLHRYPVVLAHHVAMNTIEFAKSQVGGWGGREGGGGTEGAGGGRCRDQHH